MANRNSSHAYDNNGLSMSSNPMPKKKMHLSSTSVGTDTGVVKFEFIPVSSSDEGDVLLEQDSKEVRKDKKRKKKDRKKADARANSI